jgi:alkanesulfonate monooxygenase SsuD/methylene tetrahydromethanopterin reductase-like flavin-dependent oxidoreductase (luciferase family)
MAQMGKIGIAISGGLNPVEIVDLVALAESLGYDSAWIAEGHGGDQFAILAACAMRTSRIRLGTSISSVFVRTAPTILLSCRLVRRAVHSRARFEPQGAGRARARRRRDRDAAEHAVSDAMIEATSIVGTPEQCRARIEAYRRSGVDTPILSPFARGDDAKARFEAVTRACAPAGH